MCVGRPAHHLDPAVAGVDGANAELLGIWMGPGLDHVGDREGSERAEPVGERFDLEAERGQRLGDGFEVGLGVEVVAQPRERELHRHRPRARPGTSSAEKP